MLKLRKLLCRCFGFLAMVFLFASYWAVQGLFLYFRDPGAYDLAPSYKVSLRIISFVLFALSRFIGVMPLVMAFLFGMAWWTVKKGKASGRRWAIAASLLLALSVLPILLWSSGMPRDFLIIYALFLVIGIAGIVAFLPRNSVTHFAEVAGPARIAGDGTSRLLDGFASIFAITGYLWGLNLWENWARAQGLFWSSGLSNYLLILAASLIVVVLHESGHFGVGTALGMTPHAVIFGPFQWRLGNGQWKFQFLPKKIFSLGGAAGLVPSNPKQGRWCEIWMGAAGPLMNLLTGLIALVIARTAKGEPYEQYWEFLAYFSTVSLVVFATNLIPRRSGTHYSDGARIYQLLLGGPLADYFRAGSLAASSTVTSIRSRDFDIEAIQRASDYFKQGGTAVFLGLVASEYYLDNGNISQARVAFEKAETVAEESVSEIPAEYQLELILGNAFLRRDAVAARKWWDRMESMKPTNFGLVYWSAQSALLWIEDRKEEAREAWNRGNQLSQMLPPVGGNDFERYRLSLLYDCIEKEEVLAIS